MTDINYELYKVFYCVASTLSFSEASKQLYISQSAVSQSIKVLERKLNQKLFIRSTKKVRLTPEGELLFRHVEPAINLFRHGEQRILDANTLEGGQLRIGASDTICRYFLAPFLYHFHQKYPNIQIRVLNRTSTECADLLKQGTADLIISNFPNSALLHYNNIKQLKEFQDVFLISRKFFPITEETISLRELHKLPLLMLDSKSTTSEFLRHIFAEHQLELISDFELSSNDLLIDFARIGLGVAFVPDFCIPKEKSDMCVIQTKEKIPPRHIVAVFNPTIPLPLAAEEFLHFLEKEKK